MVLHMCNVVSVVYFIILSSSDVWNVVCAVWKYGLLKCFGKYRELKYVKCLG